MRTVFKAVLCGSLSLFSLSWGDVAKPTIPQPTQAPSPWLTGPLLTPSGHVVPKGHWNIEPYFYATVNTGVYDKHWHSQSLPNFYSLLGQFPFQYGIAKDWDFQFIPQVLWNHTKGASSWALGDLPILFDYQLLMDSPKKGWPAMRLALSLNLPIGKYDKLNPHKLGTDAGGSGSIDPNIAVVFSRLFHYTGTHFLSSRLYLGYAPTIPVHVKGLSVYGGGKGTGGRVFTGNSVKALLGLEYTLAQKWALAFDAQYVHAERTRFSGHTKYPVGPPKSDQFSIAPGIEYNWSPYVGIIAGAWFSVAGHNALDFVSGIVAVNIYK